MRERESKVKLRRYLLSNTHKHIHNIIKTHYLSTKRKREERRERDKVRKGVIICTFFYVLWCSYTNTHTYIYSAKGLAINFSIPRAQISKSTRIHHYFVWSHVCKSRKFALTKSKLIKNHNILRMLTLLYQNMEKNLTKSCIFCNM